PFEVTISTPIIVICCISERFTPKACVRKITAIERYIEVPSRLKEYPVGMTRPITDREQPKRSIFCIIKGSTDSEDEVPSTITISSRINFKYFHRLKLKQ